MKYAGCPFLMNGHTMKHILWLFLAVLLTVSCGQSETERHRLSRQERLRLQREDSAALKIAVMPTIECLPVYVARQAGLFDSLGADVRLKYFTAQMDCDTALAGGSVEGAFTDLVRGQRLVRQGTPLTYVTAVETYWQLISGRNARIKSLKQLYDKMLAVTRFSATDFWGDYVVDSVKLKDERVYRVQINDVNVRMKMMLNIEMDAALMDEPQATAVRLARGKVIFDTHPQNVRLGAVAFRTSVVNDRSRRKQLDVFRKAYDMACDSIRKYGVRHYSRLIADYCHVSQTTADSLPQNISFMPVSAPRQQDVERADKWLNKR